MASLIHSTLQPNTNLEINIAILEMETINRLPSKNKGGALNMKVV